MIGQEHSANDRWAGQALSFVWILFVVGISLAPFEVKKRLYTTGALHDLGHCFFFAATAGLPARLQTTGRRRVAVALAAWGLGVALEALQWTVYKNPFEWWDLVLNAIGVLLGVWSVYAVEAVRPSIKEQVRL